jgi:hypothetical protein
MVGNLEASQETESLVHFPDSLLTLPGPSSVVMSRVITPIPSSEHVPGMYSYITSTQSPIFTSANSFVLTLFATVRYVLDNRKEHSVTMDRLTIIPMPFKTTSMQLRPRVQTQAPKQFEKVIEKRTPLGWLEWGLTSRKHEVKGWLAETLIKNGELIEGECLSWHGSARALPHYRFAIPKKSCLRRLLWKQCSYIIHKSTSCVHIDPFLRYMWSEGRPSESSWLGWEVDFSEGSRDQKSFLSFFPTGYICFFCLPSSPPLSSFCTTFTSVSPLCSTCPPCTPVFNCVCAISPTTLLHHPRPCRPVGTLKN